MEEFGLNDQGSDTGDGRRVENSNMDGKGSEWSRQLEEQLRQDADKQKQKTSSTAGRRDDRQ